MFWGSSLPLDSGSSAASSFRIFSGRKLRVHGSLQSSVGLCVSPGYVTSACQIACVTHPMKRDTGQRALPNPCGTSMRYLESAERRDRNGDVWRGYWALSFLSVRPDHARKAVMHRLWLGEPKSISVCSCRAPCSDDACSTGFCTLLLFRAAKKDLQ